MYVVRESTWICKVGSCLTNLVTFFREANKLVDKGIMADITYSVYNLPKAFKESKKSENKRKLGISFHRRRRLPVKFPWDLSWGLLCSQY